MTGIGHNQEVNSIHPRLLGRARLAGWALGLTIFTGFGGGVLVILQAFQLSGIIAGVFLNGQTLENALPAMGVLLGIILLRAVLAWGGEMTAQAAAVRVKDALRRQLAHKIVELGPVYTRGERSAELSTVMAEGVEALDAYFSQYLPQLVLAALVPLSILVFAFPVDFVSGMVLLVTAPLIPVFMILIGKTAEALTRRQWSALSRLGTHFLDTLQGLTTLKTLDQSLRQAERIGEVSARYARTTLNVLRVTFLSALVLELVGTLSTAIVAVEIGLRLLYARMGFEQALFLLILAPEFYLPLRMLGLRFHAGASGAAAARRIFEVLDTPAITGPEVHAPVIIATVDLLQIESIRFEDVVYRYPQRELDALTGLSMELQGGQQAALVGESGSGKSTALRLLLRFARPRQGRITVNEIALEDIPLEAWRRRLAWVPQMPRLFAGTVAANIALGVPDAGMEAIRRAARQANLAEFIEGLPGGYQTQIGEAGARLSGGQAQRLALARAFLLDAPLLLMDEPTAHLDPDGEDLLWQAMGELCRNRTVLLIAHRLPSVVHSDRIFVLAHGRVIEEGSHQSLVRQGGAYTALLRAHGGGE